MNDETKVYPYQRAADETTESIPRRRRKMFPIQKNFKGKNRLLYFSELSWPDWVLAAAALCLGSAEILGGLYPFGIAFAAASTIKYPKHCVLYTLLVLFGTILGQGFASIPYLIAITITWCLLYFGRQDEKLRWIICPAMVFALLAAVRVIAAMFTSFLSGYDISVIFFEGLFAGGLTIVSMFTLHLAAHYKMISRLSTDEMVCIFVLLLGCVRGLGDFAIGPISIGDVAGRTLILLAALWGGAGAGAGHGAQKGNVPPQSMMF